MNYSEMTKEQLLNEKSALEKQYEDYKAMNLNLDKCRRTQRSRVRRI